MLRATDRDSLQERVSWRGANIYIDLSYASDSEEWTLQLVPYNTKVHDSHVISGSLDQLKLNVRNIGNWVDTLELADQSTEKLKEMLISTLTMILSQAAACGAE